MKLFKKSIIALVAITPSILPALSLTSCKTDSKEDPVIVKDVFDIKDGVLMGLKQGVTQDDIRTNIKNNTLVLPAVNEIKEGAFVDGSLLNALPAGTKVVINAVTIDDYAFYGSDAASVEAELVDTKTIGKSAFAGMTKLTKIALPKTLTTIGINAFLGDSSLSVINATAFADTDTVPTCSSISTFAGLAPTGRIEVSGLTIGEKIWGAFNNCGMPSAWKQTGADGKELFHTRMPTPAHFLKYSEPTNGEVSVLGLNPLYESELNNYNHLVIPTTYNDNKVTSIADGAFCSDPTEFLAESKIPEMVAISFPQHLKSIGKYNFALMHKLTNVYMTTGDTWMPELETIGDYAFYKSTNLKDYKFSRDDKLKTIGKSAFEGTHLFEDASDKTLHIGLNVTDIGESAFSGCGRIGGLKIHSGQLTEIKPYTFYRCGNMRNVDLTSSNITKIAKGAFQSCSVNQAYLGNKIAYIDENAFKGNAMFLFATCDCTTDYFSFIGDDEIFKWYDTYDIAEYLRQGYGIYKRHIWFQHHDLVFDNTKANSLKLTLCNPGGETPTITADNWTVSIPTGCTFNKDTQILSTDANVTQDGYIKLSLTVDDPFDPTKKYTETDTINISFVDRKQGNSIDVIKYIAPTSTSEPVQVYCNTDAVSFEGDESKKYTFKIPDVMTDDNGNTRFVTAIAEEGFGLYNGRTKASKLVHISLPSVLQTINKNAFNKSGDESPYLPQKLGDTPRIVFRGKYLNEINDDKGIVLAQNAFNQVFYAPKFEVPMGVITIDHRVFSNWKQLEEISISPSVKTMYSDSITDCAEMKNLVLPEGSRWKVTVGTQAVEYKAGKPDANWNYFKSLENATWERKYYPA